MNPSFKSCLPFSSSFFNKKKKSFHISDIKRLLLTTCHANNMYQQVAPIEIYVTKHTNLRLKKKIAVNKHPYTYMCLYPSKAVCLYLGLCTFRGHFVIES